MIANFSVEELVHEVLVAPRQGLLPMADTRIIERPGWWQLVTPSIKQGGMNEVICSALPKDDAEIEATIDEALALYRELGLRFRWTIPPGAEPVDLAERLARRGMKRQEALGMARATHDVAAPSSSSITVEEVDLSNVDVFTRVMAAGWEADPAPLDKLHRRMLADPAQRHHHFIARKDGVAGCVASCVALERSAYLIGAVTLPALRGAGLYRALVHARLRHIAARNINLATTLARAGTSGPILKRLGFQVAFTAVIFTND